MKIPRFTIVAALAVVVVSCGPARQDLSGLERKLAELRSATAVGVSIMPFSDLVRGLATEITLIEGRAADGLQKDDAKAVANAKAALVAYSDSLTVWRMKLDGGRHLPVSTAGVAAIAEKYMVQPSSQFGNYDSDAIVQAAWAKASDPNGAAAAARLDALADTK